MYGNTAPCSADLDIVRIGVERYTPCGSVGYVVAVEVEQEANGDLMTV